MFQRSLSTTSDELNGNCKVTMAPQGTPDKLFTPKATQLGVRFSKLEKNITLLQILQLLHDAEKVVRY